MNTVKERESYRWVLLRHTGSPGDKRGIHFDFLFEDKEFCRTWRLSDIPLLDGPYVDSVYIAPHKLYWLDIKEKVVSGNRGVATRIKRGIFWEPLSIIDNGFVKLPLRWGNIKACLVIDENGCRIFTKRY